MRPYKGNLAYLVYLYRESLGMVHGHHCEIRESLFRYCWPRAGLDSFHQWSETEDHSASVPVTRKVQAMTRRRWIFGNASSLQAPSASKRLFGSSLSVDCQSVFHLLTSFPRDLGNGMSFSQNSMPFPSSSSCSASFTIIDGTRQSRWWAWRSSSKIDLAFGWLRSQEKE